MASLRRKSNPNKGVSLIQLKAEPDTLNERIVACSGCPRLLEHCATIAEQKKRMYAEWDYWGKPVPNFGTTDAQLLIVGLAPAAHGANRTGRMFTGDQSGVWLYRALHRAGFANQAKSEGRSDGLQLNNTLITAVCHCAPPDNKPTPEEIANCTPFLRETLQAMPNKRVILALGAIAWNALWKELAAAGEVKGARVKFSHAQTVELRSWGWLLGSYHPSQQNTFTGKLTEDAFDDIFKFCQKALSQ